ncbi:di-trans,poly-cis-decaprenylcistransferase [Candidatus Micrarchaeota archaeon CG10_big_fil_rev_8_21_14_0_10_59_7]|nr:MAG: di-trans,poly-cis-decaprenylcistransferase [Candidatus Micrarchaeota archaeon CG10_big_fil_rev_8_21_14_0_10_59_7]
MRKLNHVAIIPDGNRRYAKRRNIPISEWYALGFRKMEEAARWAAAQGVREVSFWALSADNFRKRERAQLGVLFSMMRKYALSELRENRFAQDGVRVRFFGRLNSLPRELREALEDIEKETSHNEKRSLNILIVYGGRDELLNAAKGCARDGKFDEKTFEKHLYLADAPDLIIRTGNSPRLSGFMPWQSEYSEIYFSKKLWPEFTKRDFDAAVRFYTGIVKRGGS